MLKLITTYFSILAFAFCFVSGIEYVAEISYEHEIVYEGDYLTQVKNFSSNVSEEEAENEEYTSPFIAFAPSNSYRFGNLGLKENKLDFVFIHYEVIAEPPEFIS